jgi:CDP-diacylglycerol--glycerol-3-phosphate 3-phosphatidyltransferase
MCLKNFTKKTTLIKNEEFWTIPNIITSYRLFMTPVILYFIISGQEKLFAIFLLINLLSDAIDGYVARKYHMETEIGAKLDAFADNFSYVLAFIGLFVFKMDDFRPHLVSFIIFISMLVSTVIVSLLKFRKFPTYHLWTTKTSGYIQAFFFICLFTVGFITPLYYFMIAWGIMGAIECIAINMLIPEMRSDIMGLYWVLKERKAARKQTK